MGLAVARAEQGSSYVHTCTHVYGHLLTFRYSAFTCSVNAVFKLHVCDRVRENRPLAIIAFCTVRG